MEDLGKVIANLDRVAARAYAKLFNKSLFSEQANLCTTALVSEQAPNPDSRITLSRQVRAQSCPARLAFEPNRQVHYSAIAADIAQEFERSGLGQLQIELSDDESSWQSVEGSYHHIGTTRMSINPRQGVVNEHCQVHGTTLYSWQLGLSD